MIKMDLIEIGNIPGNKIRAERYTEDLEIKSKKISSVISFLIGCGIGFCIVIARLYLF